MGRELRAAVEHVAESSEVRAIVLTGAGRGFSSGADLKAGAWALPDGRTDLLTPLREVFHPLILRLRTLEKPVIATGWSGNMDFMDDSSAALVRYRLLAARDARQVYSVPGAVWAEPDIAHAVDWLRRLADDAAARRSLRKAGKAMAQKHLGTENLAEALRTLSICVA